MKWYDRKTPDRLIILTVQMMAFMVWFNTSRGSIAYKLATAGMFMAFTTILIYEGDMSTRELIIYAALPVGLLISSAIMTVRYQDIQAVLHIVVNFLRENSLGTFWLLAAFLVVIIVDRKTKSSSR